MQEITSSIEFITLTKLIDQDEATFEEAVQQPTDTCAGVIYLSGAVIELAQRHDPSKHAKLVQFMYQLHKITAVRP